MEAISVVSMLVLFCLAETLDRGLGEGVLLLVEPVGVTGGLEPDAPAAPAVPPSATVGAAAEL